MSKQETTTFKVLFNGSLTSNKIVSQCEFGTTITKSSTQTHASISSQPHSHLYIWLPMPLKSPEILSMIGGHLTSACNIQNRYPVNKSFSTVRWSGGNRDDYEEWIPSIIATLSLLITRWQWNAKSVSQMKCLYIKFSHFSICDKN